MTEITVARGPLSLLYLFPVKDDVNLNPAGIFDPNKAPKNWADSDADLKASADYPDPLTNEPTVEYFSARVSADGSKVIRFPFRVPVSVAKTYNIPPPNFTWTESTGRIIPAWPIPIRNLGPNEELIRGDMPGAKEPQVRNKLLDSPKPATGENLILTQLTRMESKIDQILLKK